MGRGKHKYTIGREWRQMQLERMAAELLTRRQRKERSQEARQKRRPKCTCGAYPFPHRPGGGLCRWPDPPLETFKGTGGKNAPVGMRRRSAIRRRLMKRYGFHPIRDRERLRRWLPKLYVAYCRRHGYPYPELWFGGYVPAMLVTAEGPKASVVPKVKAAVPDLRTRDEIWREAFWRDNRGRR